ncbi:hypothetical protein GA0061096_0533 [Fictibacillus enclensis]|nr:hypothetical protein GA0061096_0533 [Fictibacillus enclensis]
MNHYTKHLNPFCSNSYKTQFFQCFQKKDLVLKNDYGIVKQKLNRLNQ